jgi:hypothetical protein
MARGYAYLAKLIFKNGRQEQDERCYLERGLCKPAVGMRLATCPSCGSKRIKNVHHDWVGETKGQTYMVHDLKFSECPNRGEKVYRSEAMPRIEAASPAFSKGHAPKLVHAPMGK